MMDNINVFECIRIINETNIDFKIKKNENCNINIEIRNMLKNEKIFSMLTRERTYQLLEALDIKKEKIEMVYEQLISIKTSK
jgi:uncharacterized LabA/DUF88 family protein